jgi:hypothetical protein
MSFASDQLAAVQTLLQQNVGVEEWRHEGRMVRYADLLKQYSYWQGLVNTESGTRPVVSEINLSGF